MRRILFFLISVCSMFLLGCKKKNTAIDQLVNTRWIVKSLVNEYECLDANLILDFSIVNDELTVIVEGDHFNRGVVSLADSTIDFTLGSPVKFSWDDSQVYLFLNVKQFNHFLRINTDEVLEENLVLVFQSEELFIDSNYKSQLQFGAPTTGLILESPKLAKGQITFLENPIPRFIPGKYDVSSGGTGGDLLLKSEIFDFRYPMFSNSMMISKKTKTPYWIFALSPALPSEKDICATYTLFQRFILQQNDTTLRVRMLSTDSIFTVRTFIPDSLYYERK